MAGEFGFDRFEGGRNLVVILTLLANVSVLGWTAIGVTMGAAAGATSMTLIPWRLVRLLD